MLITNNNKQHVCILLQLNDLEKDISLRYKQIYQ